MSGNEAVFRSRLEVFLEEDVECWYRALMLEENVPRSFRSKIRFFKQDEFLIVDVTSNDYSSFRAALNSVLRLLYALEGVSSVLREAW